MKTYGVIVGGVVTLLVVALCVVSFGVNRASDGSDGYFVSPPQETTEEGSFSDSAEASRGGIAAAAVDPNQSVYFFPQDTAGTTTVLRFANTSGSRQKVWWWAYDGNGTGIASGWVVLGPGQAIGRCSDDNIGIGPVWNFGAATIYVKLVLAARVVVDGYIVWNSASTYDPEVPAHTLPLRFTIAAPL